MIEYESLGRLNKSFEDEYIQCFRELLNSGWYILGKQVVAFEEAFAQYCGAKHCIGVASGLDALMLALRCYDLPAEAKCLSLQTLISQLFYLFFNVVLNLYW